MLKTVFIQIALLHYLLVGANGLIQLWHGERLLTSVELSHRTKRESDQSGPCLKKCLTEMRQAYNSKTPNGDRGNNNGIVNLDLNVRLDLPIFCPEVYKPTKSCIEKCPFDTDTYMVVSSLGPLDYMCVENYTEAISSWPCADRALNEMKSYCEKPCKLLKSEPNIGGGTIKSTVAATYTLNCKVTQCELRCQLPKLQTQCNTKSVKFVTGLIKSGFDSAQKINAAYSGKEDAPWPEECTTLQKNFLA